MTYDINLPWLAFSVNLPAVEAWVRANQGANYCGCSADYDLTLHFTAQPTDDQKSAIQAYWAGLTSESEEATSYQTAAQILAAAQAAEAAALATATSKLTALGLTDAEIAALRG
jgi:hypothetical protein